MDTRIKKLFPDWVEYKELLRKIGWLQTERRKNIGEHARTLRLDERPTLNNIELEWDKDSVDGGFDDTIDESAASEDFLEFSGEVDIDLSDIKAELRASLGKVRRDLNLEHVLFLDKRHTVKEMTLHGNPDEVEIEHWARYSENDHLFKGTIEFQAREAALKYSTITANKGGGPFESLDEQHAHNSHHYLAYLQELRADAAAVAAMEDGASTGIVDRAVSENIAMDTSSRLNGHLSRSDEIIPKKEQFPRDGLLVEALQTMCTLTETSIYQRGYVQAPLPAPGWIPWDVETAASNINVADRHSSNEEIDDLIHGHFRSQTSRGQNGVSMGTDDKADSDLIDFNAEFSKGASTVNSTYKQATKTNLPPSAFKSPDQVKQVGEFEWIERALQKDKVIAQMNTRSRIPRTISQQINDAKALLQSPQEEITEGTSVKESLDESYCSTNSSPNTPVDNQGNGFCDTCKRPNCQDLMC
ncbi:hypothetical protein BJ878DRAFT_545079 [Calycina marina]|uniref:Uncharacterized protein n=1 Tax=Calycina marina TaxID=1763456 RepID=A0A9P7YXQ9_9HELO|nr:hypothetical protein BJ878DRAFT_545079 [Calycina marina]